MRKKGVPKREILQKRDFVQMHWYKIHFIPREIFIKFNDLYGIDYTIVHNFFSKIHTYAIRKT